LYPTQTLWFEIGAASLTVLVILWTKAEYALFIYALALGFPDFAYPLGTTINVRVDDVLMLVFLARAILWTPAPFSSGQQRIFAWQSLFLAACLLSIVVETAQGTTPEGYASVKMAGCAVIFLVLPRMMQTKRRLKFFLAGLMFGGVALVVQVFVHLGENSSNDFANFQQMKDAATFATWNPNTIGQAAVLLTFAAGLGGIIFPKTWSSRIIWPCLAIGFALVPALVFVRGTSLSIAAAFILFLCMMRRWKWVLVFATAFLAVVLVLRAMDRPLVQDATKVDVTTGEGFSHRFERWGMAFQGIQTAPFLGQGFGQELNYLTLIGSEGRAHDAYLTVWLELGLGGLLLFLAVLFQFARAGLALYANRRFQPQGALLVGLISALALDSLGLSTLYWEKLPTIALSLAIVVVGLCEINDLPMASRESGGLMYQPFATHSRTTYSVPRGS
jgi:O-antigen ligase